VVLFDTAAPRTVENFLAYVNSGAYKNTFFHQSTPGFALSGGGYIFDDAQRAPVSIVRRAPIANEFSPERSNIRGTIGMAKLVDDIDSTTSEWFINLSDNSAWLDRPDGGCKGGCAVFGQVTPQSMAVVDAIAALPRDRLYLGALVMEPAIAKAGSPLTRASFANTQDAIINYQNIWWAGQAESGWGMSLTQHRNVVFGAIYTYDASGRPQWMVLGNCPLTTVLAKVSSTAHTFCTSDIYRVTNGTQPLLPWEQNSKVINKVGTGNITFSDSNANNAVFTFTIDGVSNAKNISVQPLEVATKLPAIDYTDLWWNAQEDGWGVAISQQANTIFATWYTYDATGRPTWYSASCRIINAGCAGDLYQVKGGSAVTVPWTSNNPAATRLGALSFDFTSASTAAMTYSINGVTQTRSIARQAF
jgi:cyclophilin family peptidyl-prolyl cis-trans isomerase